MALSQGRLSRRGLFERGAAAVAMVTVGKNDCPEPVSLSEQIIEVQMGLPDILKSVPLESKFPPSHPGVPSPTKDVVYLDRIDPNIPDSLVVSGRVLDTAELKTYTDWAYVHHEVAVMDDAFAAVEVRTPDQIGAHKLEEFKRPYVISNFSAVALNADAVEIMPTRINYYTEAVEVLSSTIYIRHPHVVGVMVSNLTNAEENHKQWRDHLQTMVDPYYDLPELVRVEEEQKAALFDVERKKEMPLFVGEDYYQVDVNGDTVSLRPLEDPRRRIFLSKDKLTQEQRDAITNSDGIVAFWGGFHHLQLTFAEIVRTPEYAQPQLTLTEPGEEIGLRPFWPEDMKPKTPNQNAARLFDFGQTRVVQNA